MTEIVRKLRDVYFDLALQIWIKNKARQERWRVAGWYSVGDLEQDGYICYCKCRDKYTTAPPEPGDRPDGFAHQDLFTLVDGQPNEIQRRHFMSLVQRAFINHISTLSSNYPISKEEPVDCSVIEDSVSILEGLAPPVPEETTVLMALANAPTEISSAISVLISDGLEGQAYLRSKLHNTLVVSKHASGGVSVSTRTVRGRRALRETTVERFQRLLGDGEVERKTVAYLYS